MEQNFLLALSLTLIAGISTGVGSILAVFVRRSNTKFLAFSLGISSGVIIYVSMVEILMKAREYLTGAMGTIAGSWVWVASFFFGIILIGLVDFFIPSTESDIGSTEARPRADGIYDSGSDYDSQFPGGNGNLFVRSAGSTHRHCNCGGNGNP